MVFTSLKLMPIPNATMVNTTLTTPSDLARLHKWHLCCAGGCLPQRADGHSEQMVTQRADGHSVSQNQEDSMNCHPIHNESEHTSSHTYQGTCNKLWHEGSYSCVVVEMIQYPPCHSQCPYENELHTWAIRRSAY